MQEAGSVAFDMDSTRNWVVRGGSEDRVGLGHLREKGGLHSRNHFCSAVLRAAAQGQEAWCTERVVVQPLGDHLRSHWFSFCLQLGIPLDQPRHHPRSWKERRGRKTLPDSHYNRKVQPVVLLVRESAARVGQSWQQSPVQENLQAINALLRGMARGAG